MHVTVRAVAIAAIADHHTSPESSAESSATLRARVESARERQRARYRTIPTVQCNAQASGLWIDTCTPIDPDARAFLMHAAARLSLSARAYHRTLKVARTVADLDEAHSVTHAAVAEAVRYRAPAATDDRGVQ
jgi:magnesium chelatase family protein